MIDWISATVPLDWETPICGGFIVNLTASGDLEWETTKTFRLVGSFDSGLSLRTVERGKIEVSGNPAKFFQGHNLFGVDDVKGLMWSVLTFACEHLNVTPSQQNLLDWITGNYPLTRVDLTFMYALDSFSQCSSWIQALSQSCNVKWRGRGHYQDGTLYFGKVKKGARASRWQLKIYHKGSEIGVRGHQLSEKIVERQELYDWALNKVRVELTLRSQEMKDKGWLMASCWNEDLVKKVFDIYVKKLEIGDKKMIDVKVEDKLSPRLMAAVYAWKAGADCRAMYPRPTFYRYRKEILKQCDIDIGVLCPQTNVIPLQQVLIARPVDYPDWAEHLVFKPEMPNVANFKN